MRKVEVLGLKMDALISLLWVQSLVLCEADQTEKNTTFGPSILVKLRFRIEMRSVGQDTGFLFSSELILDHSAHARVCLRFRVYLRIP